MNTNKFRPLVTMLFIMSLLGTAKAAIDSSEYGHWNDTLNSEQAQGRFTWLETCARGVLVEFWEQMYGYNSEMDSAEKINQLRNLWLTEDGKAAEFPYYLTFGDENHQNPKGWYAGVVDSNSNTPIQCTTIPEGYAPIGLLKTKNTKAYCKVTGVADWEYIKEVSIDDRVSQSGSQNYSNFTNPVFPMKLNSVHTLKMTPGFHGEDEYEEGWSAFIDWNQDGRFDETSELVVYEEWVLGTVEKSIRVPANAKVGYTKMRITIDGTAGDPNPCQNVLYGEIEDYYVKITD